MTAHTPGPWITDSKERTDTARYIMAAARPFPHTIARIDLVNRAEDEANATLIAAAPDMYEALRELIAVKPNSDAPEWVAARAAIDRAEGHQ